MKVLALLVCGVALSFAQMQEGNFDIRFEPQAKLQAGVPVPFQIPVLDDLHKPVTGATVTLSIETTSHKDAHTFKAPAVGSGLYMAKPLFPEAGQWNVAVEVRRGDRMSSRTITFSVPD